MNDDNYQPLIGLFKIKINPFQIENEFQFLDKDKSKIILDNDIPTHDLNILQVQINKNSKLNFMWTQFHNCIYPMVIEKNEKD